jgi:predicted transcriptional regulator
MKKPISATIDAELIKWLDNIANNNSSYRNKSHIIEVALENFKSKIEFQEKAVKKK